MEFSNNLRYLRKERGMSQDDLANKLGYKSFTTIQKWESGVSEPSVSTVKIISDIFGVTMDQIINKDLSSASASSFLQLTVQDKKILSIFRRLSDIDQAKLIAYGEGLAAASAYDLNARLREEGRGTADIGLKYGCDLEGQLRKDANEIVRNEYENAAKSKSIAK